MGFQPMSRGTPRRCLVLQPKGNREATTFLPPMPKIAALVLLRSAYRSNIAAYRDHGLEAHATSDHRSK
jgi:hypothetical protein